MPLRGAYVGRQPMTLNGSSGTTLTLLDVERRGDSPLHRAPGFHAHAGQRHELVPFVGPPVPRGSTVLVRSVRHGGPTATQRQAPKDSSGSPTKCTTRRPEWRVRMPRAGAATLHLPEVCQADAEPVEDS